MFEAMSVTQMLAVFAGLYMIAAGLGLMLDRDLYPAIINELRESAALGYVTAAFVFVLGAAIIAIHNLWNTPLEIIVSLIGWGALIEGLLMLAVRRQFMSLVGAIDSIAKMIIPIGIITIVIGVLLVYFGIA